LAPAPPCGRQSSFAADQAETPHRPATKNEAVELQELSIRKACHARCSLRYDRWAKCGTALFVSINTIISPSLEMMSRMWPLLHILAAVLSIGSAVVFAVQCVLKPEAISEQHKAAAKSFARLHVRLRDMHLMPVIPYPYRWGGEKPTEWQEWRKDYMDALEQAPMISPDTYKEEKDKMDVSAGV